MNSLISFLKLKSERTTPYENLTRLSEGSSGNFSRTAHICFVALSSFVVLSISFLLSDNFIFSQETFVDKSLQSDNVLKTSPNEPDSASMKMFPPDGLVNSNLLESPKEDCNDLFRTDRINREYEEDYSDEEISFEKMILAQCQLQEERFPYANGSTPQVAATKNNRQSTFAGCRIRSSCYNWFDEQQKKYVPVKIYFPQNLQNAERKAPVIIFSHGLGGSYESCAYLGEYWAVNGYVSVHLQHLGSDETVWRGKLRPVKELKKVYRQCWSGRDRVLDIQFALMKLQLLSNEPQSYLATILDLNHVGIAGYDLGAYAALLMAGQLPPEGGTSIHDPRVKAILSISPPFPPHSAPITEIYAPIEVPGLFFTGTRDEGIIGTTTSAQRRIPFDTITCNDQYLVTFDGTDHLLYAGHFRSILPRNDVLYHTSIARLSANFWNAYLKEDPNALAFMMSRNVVGLVNRLGKIERKFYPRNESQDSTLHTIPQLPDQVSAQEQRVHRGDLPENRLTPRRLRVPQR